MSRATFLLGDVFDVMATLPDESVDLVLTSPPFLALRSYLPADHPDKGKEIGSEPTPAEFIDTLLALTAEWGRLLAPHGSICVELGDTYSGSGGAGGDYDTGKMRGDQSKFGGSALADRKNKVLNANGQRMQQGPGWPLDKSMCGIPHLYHLSLAYGRNILTGEESPAGMWRIRNVVAWCRPNPPVGALSDKFRPATSYMTIATKARDRWFDLDAVRTKNDHKPHTDNRGEHRRDGIAGRTGQVMNPVDADGKRIQENAAGAPPLDWWEVSTEAYAGSHYATWPRKLLDRPIQAMCPLRVCTTCGEPRRRITGEPTYVRTDSDTVPARLTMLDGERPAEGVNQHVRPDGANTSVIRTAETIGWTDCGHDTYRRGHVLDPFGGSGTTAVVATGHGRDCTLIDIDERNIDLARSRVGMFLETPEPEEAA